jgi:hypothetical protein
MKTSWAWLRCGFAGLATLAGCSNDFEPASRIDTLRVLAVVPEPASGAPGQTSTLDLVIADGASSTDSDGGAPRALQVAWLAGCNNPPGRQFNGCYPLLQTVASHLSPRVLDTPSDALPPNILGTSSRFELAVPKDILSAAPKSASDPVHFGVSYAFFAVCAGELRPRADVTDRVPLDCVDTQSGQLLGRRDFITGYATLYSYDGVTNHNPVLDSIRFGGATVAANPCKDDSDCEGLVDPASAGFDEVCGSNALCSPRVLACPSSGSCPSILITPDIPVASAEPLPAGSAHEILWASYYATRGVFDTETQLVNDRNTGFIPDHGSYFRPPRAGVGPGTVWVTVNDERGGAAFQSFEVWTR